MAGLAQLPIESLINQISAPALGKEKSPEEKERLAKLKLENQDARQAMDSMSYGDRIHLMLTSVSMPGSVQAVNLAKEKDPGVKALKQEYVELAAKGAAGNANDNALAGIFFTGVNAPKKFLLILRLLTKGVPLRDIEALDKDGLRLAKTQHLNQRDDAVETQETLSIIGNKSRKRMRAEKRMFAQIIDKLARVGGRLSLPEEYSAENLVAVRLEKCREILGRFKEEKVQLEYQLEMAGSARAVV